MELYAFFSDGHKLDGGKTDNHKGVAYRCKKMIRWLAPRCKEIFNLGDNVCWRQAKRRANKNDALQDIAVYNHEELALERAAGVEETEGNHDEGNGAPKRHEFIAAGNAGTFHFIAMHGHQFDIWCSRFGFVGIAATYISGWLERRGWWNAEAILSKFAKRIPGRKQKESVYWKGMKKEVDRISRRNKALGIYQRIVFVIGHTHRKKMLEYKGHLLVQDGRTSSRCVQCFLFDIDTGKGYFKSF